jgi:putative tricarboxylic transport membrane protein
LVFSVIGAYAGTYNVHHIWMMVGFGLIGYFGQKHRFSPAAILLGLILGPIAESGFRDMMVVSDGNPSAYILGRPISLALIALAIGVAFKPKPWEAGEPKAAAVAPAGD